MDNQEEKSFISSKMVKFSTVLFIYLELCCLIMASNCDNSSGPISNSNNSNNAIAAGQMAPVSREDQEFKERNSKDDNTNVQHRPTTAPSMGPTGRLAVVMAPGTSELTRDVRSSQIGGPEIPLRRMRRAPPRRKIPLAKAPKPTSTSTTTTTTTTTTATTSVEPAGGDAEDEYEEEEEQDPERGQEQQQQQRAEPGSGSRQISSTTRAPELTTRSKPAGTNTKQQLVDRKGRKNETTTKGFELSKTNSSSTMNSKGVSATEVSKQKKPLVPLPFIRPKNESICTPEAYLEFPHDLIGNKWRARGFVLIHVAVVCYMFYSLALVCERYFMPSLEEFSQRLQLSEDVAGATLMSAGSSAPELFTAVLGVFIAKGDVGTGAIVGSAASDQLTRIIKSKLIYHPVFNILFVIGVCAFVSTTTAQLNWWPVLRDSVFYTFTVLVLIVFIYDERVTALESFSMIALYGVYILIMVHNETIKGHVTRVLLSHPVTSKLISSAVSLDGPDDVFGSSSSNPNQHESDSIGGTSKFQQRRDYQTTPMINGPKTVEEDSMFLAAMLVIVQHRRLFRSQLRFQSAARYIIVKRQHKFKLQQQKQQQKSMKCSNEVNYFGPESEPLNSGSRMDAGGANQKQRIEAYASSAALSKNKFSIVSKDDYEFWNRPPEEGENYYTWLAKIPVNYVLHYTIPDCTLYPDKYLYTFLISITWTAIFSYIMVWMVTLIGYTLGIPDSVMGVTFLAAGTSIPDCYSSVHAARNGMADMAVSNSIGSNVFDILIGLSLPWFIQSAIYPGVVATINSRGVIYSVVLLFLSLIVTIYLMNKYEWTLKPRLGLALLIAYGLFIVLTCMLEFNLFGNVNPPPCEVVG